MVFPCPGRTVAYNKSNWAALYENPQKAHRRWLMVGKLVPNTEVTLLVWGILYKAVMQLVFLYCNGSRVVMGEMLKVQDGFNHRIAKRIVGMMAQRTMGGEWEWPPVNESMETTGIWPIKEYIQRGKETVAAQVA